MFQIINAHSEKLQRIHICFLISSMAADGQALNAETKYFVWKFNYPWLMLNISRTVGWLAAYCYV